MEVKRAQVIMLPTEDKTNIIYNSSLKILGDANYFSKVAVTLNNYINHQHLYITTDDEIKEGDWYRVMNDPYNTGKGSIAPADEEHIQLIQESNYICNKVIATTDKSLKIPYMHSYSKQREVNGVLQVKSLPQIPQLFIKEYCDKGGIDEVLVEYMSYHGINTSIAEINTISGDNDMNWKGEYRDFKLKVDSHNTITIHQIKDSWSREELQTLCYKHSNDQVLGALLRKIIL